VSMTWRGTSGGALGTGGGGGGGGMMHNNQEAFFEIQQRFQMGAGAYTRPLRSST